MREVEEGVDDTDGDDALLEAVVWPPPVFWPPNDLRIKDNAAIELAGKNGNIKY